MILDALGLLSDAQAFATDDYCTSSVDLGNVTPKRNIGEGEPLAILITVDVAGTGGGAYEFSAIQSANANLTSYDVLASIFPAEADLSIGSVHMIPLPRNITKRYVGLYFNNVSGVTGVTVTAVLVPLSFIEKRTNYADGFTIS